jgi:lysophospholipase L1-like esterase
MTAAMRPNRSDDAVPGEPLPAWKRRLFMGITLAIPLVALAAAELGLRLAGWGGYPAFFRIAGQLPSGASVALVEPAATKPYFFANPTRPGYAEETNFLIPKPADTVRIFIVGESAAKGYPQPRNLSMASFLQALLGDAWPEKKVEVISLGTTAVASFPLVYLTREAVRYEPDLMVFYVGNNEFFGAYGVASINSFGTLPTWALPWMRALRGLAVVQAVEGVVRGKADENRSLMEQMVGKTVIPADSPLRAAAARNLETHLGRMLDAVRAAGIPAVVCTTASNEAGLAPLGEGGEAATRFALAKKQAAAGDRPAARDSFLAARDLDTMPWRPISATEQAIRRAAAERDMVLCDVAEVFRALSAEPATGWDLLDDHVHLSLRGQAEVARAIAASLATLPEGVRVDASRVEALPDWKAYAERLGTNEWDDYRVNHTLRVLFGVPFMKRTNRAAFDRFETACRETEARMSPEIREEARQWQSFRPHAGGLRPLTGMVARVMLRENKPAEAERLYAIAERQVPDYTSWYLEYLYFKLACRQRINGRLSSADLDEAGHGIAQGRFLLRRGYSQTGLTERYVGRLHQLRGEWRESVEPLLAARSRLAGTDLVACDQALVQAYVETGNVAAARAIVAEGLRGAGRLAPAYKNLEAQITAPGASAGQNP